MNAFDLAEIINACPELYHMAERGAWKGIQSHGLLSTSALLDLYGIEGHDREIIESQRRKRSFTLRRAGEPTAIVRDQLPMDDAGLLRCLPSSISPSDWYRFLNQKVFFWLSKERLERLENAVAYRGKEHEVLVVDTARLVSAYYDQIWLSPINSGATKPMPAAREYSTFSRIPDYPYQNYKRRKPSDRVAELCIDLQVPDILKFIKRGYVSSGNRVISELV